MGSLPSGQDRYARPYSAGGATVLVRSVDRQLNHSPIDSPPTVKKKLCRIMDGLVHADISQVDGAIESLLLHGGGIQKGGLYKELLNDVKVRHVPVVGKRSILKRSASVTRSAYSTRRGSSTPRSSSAGSRRVQFNGDVTVYMISDEGHICTECHRLNTEPHEHRMGTLTRPRYSPQQRPSIPKYVSSPYTSSSTSSSSSSSSSTSSISSPTQRSPDYDSIQKTVLNSLQYRSTAPVVARSAPTISSSSADYDNVFYDSHAMSSPSASSSSSSSGSEVLVEGSSVNFTFIEDNAKGVMLKFIVPLGLEYHPDDIVVKANVNGSKVRVVARKVVPGSNGSSASMEEVSRRYALPMDVDPYAVSARLDIRGNLTVEAPLMTLARRDTMRGASSAHFNSSSAHSRDSTHSSSARSISV